MDSPTHAVQAATPEEDPFEMSVNNNNSNNEVNNNNDNNSNNEVNNNNSNNNSNNRSNDSGAKHEGSDESNATTATAGCADRSNNDNDNDNSNTNSNSNSNNNNSNNSNSHSNNDVATTNPSARQNERLCGNLEQGAQMFLTMVQVQRDQLRDSHVARAVQNATPGSWDDARRTASEVVCNAGTWISEGRDRLFETAPERWLQVRTGASEAVAMAGDWVEQASSAVSSSIRRTDVSGEDRPLATWFRERFGTSNDEGQEVVLEAVEPTEPYQVGGSSGSNAYPADGGGEWVGEEWADEETWNQEAPAGPSLGHSFEELSRGPTSPRRPLNPDEEIKRYLFSDENTVVKVYIQASDLDISKIASADVTLSPTTLSIRIQSADNATLVLSKQRLSHAIDVDKSRHNLPKTGHKLSITLCKADPRQVWTQLFSKQGQTETLTPMTFI